jgi:hypothetical protein
MCEYFKDEQLNAITFSNAFSITNQRLIQKLRQKQIQN